MGAIGKLQAEPDIGIIEVEAGEIADTLQAIEHRVSMDSKDCGCFFWPAATGEEGSQCTKQFGPMLPVVVDEQIQRIVMKAAQFGELPCREQKPVDTKVFEASNLSGPIEPARHRERLFGFLV